MIGRASTWVMTRFGQLRRREDGQAAAEYGVLLALILVVSITLIATLGNQIAHAFTQITQAL